MCSAVGVCSMTSVCGALFEQVMSFLIMTCLLCLWDPSGLRQAAASPAVWGRELRQPDLTDAGSVVVLGGRLDFLICHMIATCRVHNAICTCQLCSPLLLAAACRPVRESELCRLIVAVATAVAAAAACMHIHGCHPGSG